MLLLDSGNFSDTPTELGNYRTKILLEAMERLGYQVVNVGERDIRTGYAKFEERTKETPFQYISANIVDRGSKKPIFPPHAVVEAVSPDGKAKARVGVIGIARYNPIFVKDGPRGGKMIIDHPAERVRREVEALRKKKVDVVVLLAALHKDDAKKIVMDVPGIDFILGSYGGQFTSQEEKAGETNVLYCGNRGQRIGESRVFFGRNENLKSISEVRTKLHVLTRHYPADQEMLDFVNLSMAKAPADPATKTSALPEASGAQAAR